MMTSQNTSNSEVTMDDVDADKEFENQENIAPPRKSDRTRRQKSNKSTSCTIT
ncbi:hypothetical protein HOLleu_41661 [Holothuria leucospilota]|uniref:Uncharacterized protein n=1 Tax=Holothuria leucospilota TaxID=206669 RepID=A0A9Q0YC15_HOLLE|nr:hypothetical protein HOLleu_41661 [Holothuria leucospilota]